VSPPFLYIRRERDRNQSQPRLARAPSTLFITHCVTAPCSISWGLSATDAHGCLPVVVKAYAEAGEIAMPVQGFVPRPPRRCRGR
jgi:hypothetical protein